MHTLSIVTHKVLVISILFLLTVIVIDANKGNAISHKINLICRTTLYHFDPDVESFLSLIDYVIDQVDCNALLSISLIWFECHLLYSIVKLVSSASHCDVCECVCVCDSVCVCVCVATHSLLSVLWGIFENQES